MPGDAGSTRATLDALARRARVRAFVVVVTAAAVAHAQRDEATELARLARLGPAHATPAGGRLGLVQALRDARNDRRVAIVAAHPDDQYVLPATYLRLNEGYRVTVILMTRGEGGQNREGPETGDELARLRTLETEACARRLGLEVENVNLPDAGYSRNAAETFALWGRDETVRALALALRRTRPDIVLTTHHPGETHGHDLALLDVLPDAVRRAAEPGASIDDLAPVAIDRVYRGCGPGEDAWFELPTDDVDPELGETFRNLAYRALTDAHRSQGPFLPVDEFFGSADRLVGVRIGSGPTAQPPVELHEGLPDLFALLRDTLSPAAIQALQQRFDVELPSSVADRPRLAVEALRLRDDLLAVRLRAGSPAADRRARRVEALERVVLHAIGVRCDVRTERAVAVPGERLRFTVVVESSGLVPIPALDLDAGAAGGAAPVVTTRASLSRPHPWRIGAELTLPRDAARDDPLDDLFRRDRFRMPCSVSLRIGVARPDAEPVSLEVPLELPVAVRPPIELEARPRALLVPDGATSALLNVRVHRNTSAPIRDRLRLQLPPGFEAEPAAVDLDLATESAEGHLFRLGVPTGLRAGPQPVRIRLGAATARVELRRVSVAFPSGLRIGLVEGVADVARTVLSQLDCELVVLDDATLPTRPLDDLDTILVDVRALGHRRAARAEFNRLLDFVESGGRLVVLYHKDTELDVELTGQQLHPRGLPLRIGRGRVTREDAPVTVRLPEDPLLNDPNRIQAVDWDGWTQERGLYFASSWDPAYAAPLELADPGQPTERGALLRVRSGRGEFVYCALALHRQLENLHPGACRLFANLLAHRRVAR